MLKMKVLSSEKLIYYQYATDSSTKFDVTLCTMGLFDTKEAKWKYYVCPTIQSSRGIFLTSDFISGKSHDPLSESNIPVYGKRFNTLDECISFINEYKMKWESGSNDTKQEIRDKKIDEIT